MRSRPALILALLSSASRKASGPRSSKTTVSFPSALIEATRPNAGWSSVRQISHDRGCGHRRAVMKDDAFPQPDLELPATLAPGPAPLLIWEPADRSIPADD